MCDVADMDIPIYGIFLTFLLVTTVQSSRKKGVGIDLQAYQCNDLKALTNIAWWYNWGPNFDRIESVSKCTIDDKYLESFVPMIWGYGPNWTADKFRVDDRNDIILGFNEPNHINQSDLTPQEAADVWYIVEQSTYRREVVSPAAAKCGQYCNGDIIEWFDEFFSILCAPDPGPCRVDYLATHIYKCKAAQTMRKLQELYDRYHLKIWLTEFACPNTYSVDAQLEYMAEVLPLLEKSDIVYKYAWYVHRKATPDAFINEAANLFETGSSTLTILGEYYNSYTYPEDPGQTGVCKRTTK